MLPWFLTIFDGIPGREALGEVFLGFPAFLGDFRLDRSIHRSI